MTYNLDTIAATDTLAKAIAKACKSIDCVLLKGDLGTGKTTFARAFLGAFGWQGDVPSPTYTLIQHYPLPQADVYHADLYRVNAADELEEIGLYDALAQGLCLIEWPERLPKTPTPSLTLHFTLARQRTVTINGSGHWQEFTL